ncbi:dienelactone hydrolase family protein [Muricoccus radiodurans]|uniref:dienelactone hydrolase family protein n=1 Tax=Muricoccus radiodurans TaxID=2231721 RepID=UPI003CEB8B40
MPAASKGEVLEVPVATASGEVRTIRARLCRPASADAARLVVINHGSPGGNPAIRARYSLLACDSEPARWFLDRGHAVLAPLRRGYGPEGGAWEEAYGRCEDPDYVRAARETARDIAAAIAVARGQPGIAPGGVAVIGQSAGGWGALAIAADPPPGVTAVVNVAGGRGGQKGDVPNENCRPDRLVADAGRLARGAAEPLPMLWLYTANDGFFAPELAAAMHAAHRAAGGWSELRPLPAWGRDGHDMFYGRGGAAVWGPIVEAWLATHP